MPELTHTDVPAELADHDLLRRFVLDRDDAAFAEIVRRHQRLVMGICKRITADQNDAEDAFQAVFLALARRPRSIRRATSLSSWLYTVAWRTSHRLVRRRKSPPVEVLDQPIPIDDPDPLEQITAEQNADVLHAELNLLPERYRQVLVMTYFAHQTSQQIADQLHLTKGAVDGRIRQARNIMRVRLARRGISLGVLTVVAVSLHSPEVVAAATPGLLENTIHLGSQTLTNSLPGTVDVSHLEPLLRTEIAMVKWNGVTAIGAFVALVVGVAGMAQVDEQAANTSGVVTTVINTTANVAEEVVADRDASVVVGSIPNAAVSTEARNVWLQDMMKQPIPDLEFTGVTPLREVLDVLAEHYTQTYGGEQKFPMTFWFNDAALRENGFDSLDEMTVAGAKLKAVSLRRALDLIFTKTGRLTWDIHDGILEVTSVQELESNPRHRETRTYMVKHLYELELESVLREHLRSQQVYFQTEDDNGEKRDLSAGSLTMVEHVLIVTHHRRGLEAVEELLKSLGLSATRVDFGPKPGSLLHRSDAMVPVQAPSKRRQRRADLGPGYISFEDRSTVVNLSDNNLTRFLSVSFVLKVDPGLAELTRQRLDSEYVRLKDWLGAQIADKSLDDVSGKAGQDVLRNEIREQFSQVLFPDGDNEIEDVYFQEFAVQ
jgi:RNA polymerase sigma factor (sigma-70 family)